MRPYVISACSPADLSKQYFEERNIPYLCFEYELADTTYTDDLFESVSASDFYQAMVDGAMTRTSQMNQIGYEEFFESILKEGNDLLHFTLSSGISGTYNSARMAAEALREKYPERKIYVVDSKNASSGFGLLVEKAKELQESGMDIDTLHEWIEAHKLECHAWFFSGDLTFFIRGGRISKTAGTIGNMLRICPLMQVDSEGKLVVRQKIHGKRKVIRAIVEKMEEYAENGHDYHWKVFISHSNCLEDANAVKELVEEKFPNTKGKITIFNIGPVIGAHTGPGTVTLFFWGKDRSEIEKIA